MSLRDTKQTSNLPYNISRNFTTLTNDYEKKYLKANAQCRHRCRIS